MVKLGVFNFIVSELFHFRSITPYLVNAEIFHPSFDR